MLFNSLEFVLFFLPITLGVYLLIERKRKPLLTTIWLITASILFYAWWNWVYSFLLISSLIGNYFFALTLKKYRNKLFLVSAILMNILLIGYYKYHNFFIDNINYFSESQLPYADILLPLGISFFTFQQIAFLIDVYTKKASEITLSKYLLFICFFPQLIAGPIVHYREIAPQFGLLRSSKAVITGLQLGASIFLIGLFKKYALADSLAVYVSPVFSQADNLMVLDGLTAWRATIAYAFQIYFDFSGYSDMAIGLACLFGLRLPLNFFSPYKTRNISDFWRCWHITLSNFLRDYLYIPLGGNRKGLFRKRLNLMIVMFVGGLWHGAGWNFALWGTLHGLYLILFHSYQGILRYLPFQLIMPKVMSWGITFLCVCIAWVFFRTETIEGALHMLNCMFDFGGWEFKVQEKIDIQLLFTFLLIIVAPNTFQLMRSYNPCVTPPPKLDYVVGKSLEWRASLQWALFFGCLLAAIIILMITGQPSEFIYFQF